RLAVNDVNAAAIRLPARHAGGKMFVGVGDALVMLFLVFVLFGIGSRVTALPEGLDEVVALLVIRKLLEGRALFVRDDPDHVLFQPLLVGLAQLDLEGSLVLRFLFLIGSTFEGVDRIGGRSLCAGGVFGRLVGALVGGLRLGRVFRSRRCRLILGKGTHGYKARGYQQNS